jgi:transposase
MSGVDLTAIDAIGVGVVQVLLSEYGPDPSCFPTEKHFISHLALTPKKLMSGGKPLKKKKRGSASSRIVSQVLRNAAMSVRNSQTALGAYFRHIAQRLGIDVAAFATARKLATLCYRLLRWGHPYLDEEPKPTRNAIKPLASIASSPLHHNSDSNLYQRHQLTEISTPLRSVSE